MVYTIVTLVRDRKISRTTRGSKAAGKETVAEERMLAMALTRGRLISPATRMAAVGREDRLDRSMPRKPVPETMPTAPRRPLTVVQRSRLQSDRTNPTLHRRMHPLMVAGTVNRRWRPVSPANQPPINSKGSAPRPLRGPNPTPEAPRRRRPLVLPST